MLPYNRGLPIWMQDPSVYYLIGFAIEVVLLSIALFVVINATLNEDPNLKKCGLMAFVLTGIKYLFTNHMYIQPVDVTIARLIATQTCLMYVLVLLTLLTIFQVPFKKAILASLIILLFQYAMNIALNFLMCAPFFTPTNIDSLQRKMQEINSAL